MKKLIYVLFPLVAAMCVNSCLPSGDIQETPKLSVLAIRNNTDTLKGTWIQDISSYCLDTLEIGDSVRFSIWMYSGVQNLLKEFIFDFNSEVATIYLENKPKLDSIFSHQQSDYDRGIFVVDVKANEIWLPIIYIPIDASSNTTVSFTVKSDSEYSPTILRLRTPIRAKSE